MKQSSNTTGSIFTPSSAAVEKILKTLVTLGRAHRKGQQFTR